MSEFSGTDSQLTPVFLSKCNSSHARVMVPGKWDSLMERVLHGFIQWPTVNLVVQWRCLLVASAGFAIVRLLPSSRVNICWQSGK